MPRDLVIVSDAAPDLSAFVVAGADVAPDLRVRTLDGAAVTEIVDRSGTAVLSIGVPELLEAPGEPARLLPATTDDPVWWTEAWAPWGPAGDVGVRVARAFADAIGGRCVVEDGS